MFVVLGSEVSKGVEVCCMVVVNGVRGETNWLDNSVVCCLGDRVEQKWPVSVAVRILLVVNYFEKGFFESFYVGLCSILEMAVGGAV